MWLMQNSWLRCYIITSLCFQTARRHLFLFVLAFALVQLIWRLFPLSQLFQEVEKSHRNPPRSKETHYRKSKQIWWSNSLTPPEDKGVCVCVCTGLCVLSVCAVFSSFVGLCTDMALYRREGVQPSVKLRSQCRSEHEFTTTVFILTKLWPPKENIMAVYKHDQRVRSCTKMCVLFTSPLEYMKWKKTACVLTFQLPSPFSL